MRRILFIYLKTTSMKINWKKVALYVLRVIEMCGGRCHDATIKPSGYENDNFDYCALQRLPRWQHIENGGH